MARQQYRLRIRTQAGDTRWIIGGTRYSLPRAEARAEALRQAGHVVHVDLTGRGWH